MLFSIIRLRRTFYPIRTLLCIAVVFFIAWLALTAQLYWECEKHTTWKRAKVPQCLLSPTVGVCQLISKRRYLTSNTAVDIVWALTRFHTASGCYFRQYSFILPYPGVYEHSRQKATFPAHADLWDLCHHNSGIIRSCWVPSQLQTATHRYIGPH